MRLRLFLLVSSLLALPCAAAGSLDAPGPEIVRGENDAAWLPLFATLAGQGPVFAQLTEQRWFRVRQKPVELAAEMRLAPDHGLSLRYEDGRTLIIDARGVLLRDKRGRSRVMKSDDRVPAVNTWLLPVLRFDRAALEKEFVLHGARAGDDWRLDFVPRSANAAPDIGTITVHGSREAVARIELRPKADLRVEILIEQTETGVTFSADDVQRFFR